MKFEETVWYLEAELQWETELYAVFKDGFPVTPGHLLFVPKTTEWPDRDRALISCFTAAYGVGQERVRVGQCEGFNVGINHGAAAGQTINYPHVHLILRNEGDTEDHIGGVRHVVKGQGNYKSPEYKNPNTRVDSVC